MSPRLRDIRHAIVAWLDRYMLRITVVALIGAFFFVFFAHRIVVTIPAGYRGVLWQRFGGTNVYRSYGEGLRFIFPWNEIVPYNVRFQTDTRNYEVVDAEGLTFTIQLSTRYRANEKLLGQLHKSVGPNYFEVIVAPQVASNARAVVATMTAQDVYSRLRAEIEKSMLQQVRNDVDLEFSATEHVVLVYIEDIFLRQITLPRLVASAIEEKVRQFHMIEEWKFRREREEIEAERMRLEGRGIRNFQEEAGRSLTDQYLRLKAIEATLKLAQSPNAKTVIIGSGPQGLPVILGNEGVRAGARGGEGVAPAAGDAQEKDTTPTNLGDPSGVLPAGPQPAPGAVPPPVAKLEAPKPPPAPEGGWLSNLVGRITRLVGR